MIDVKSLEKWVGRHYSEMKIYMNPFEPETYFRLLPPNSLVTTEFNPKRVNVHIDNNGTILKFGVG